MMANRGFDTLGSTELRTSERTRASQYIHRAYDYFFKELFPPVSDQLAGLASLRSPNETLYRSCLSAVPEIAAILNNGSFRSLVDDDPRHLLLLASSRRYPFVFDGYQGRAVAVPSAWQQAACGLLKMVHLIKSIEEDSQDINDYAELGFFLEARGIGFDDLSAFTWDRPPQIPDTEPARRAFVKISLFSTACASL